MTVKNPNDDVAVGHVFDSRIRTTPPGNPKDQSRMHDVKAHLIHHPVCRLGKVSRIKGFSNKVISLSIFTLFF